MKTGAYVEVTSNTYKKKYGFGKGTKGRVVSMIALPDGEYVTFMPDNVLKMFVMTADNVIEITEEEAE